MTQETTETDSDRRHLIEKYPDAHDAVRDHIAGALTEVIGSDSGFSDDWVIQMMQDASQICNAHSVDNEDRVDLICEAFRSAQYNQTDQAIDQFKFQVKMLQGI